MANELSLRERLSAAGVEPVDDPVTAWRKLRKLEGRRATVVDLYRLVAEARGVQAHELPLSERDALGRAALYDAWPGFEVTDGSERAGDTIAVVSYSADWPARYEQWASVLRASLGDAALRVEHVGSTSVPGLPAKPVIDIQVSVANLHDEDTYRVSLEDAGLQLRSRDDFHRYFRPFPGRPRDVHVHVCPVGSGWEREHTLFRDYLRVSPSAREAYAAAKRRAAATWPDDRIAYTEAKSDIILSILQTAEHWASESRH